MKRFVGLAAMLAALGGCQKAEPSKPPAEARFCTPLLTNAQAQQAEADAHDPAAKARAPEWGNSSAAAFETLARDCLARFARQYAPAADSADSVAKAVTTACATEVGFVTSDAYYAHLKSGMNDQLAKLVADGSKVKFADEAQRLVVEARAGHCAPPPLPSQPRSPDLRD